LRGFDSRRLHFTFWLNRADSAVSFGGNDFVLPLLFPPARVGVHRGLEVGLIAMAVDAERGVEIAQPDAAVVDGQHARVVAQLEQRFPEAAALLEEAGSDLLGPAGATTRSNA
jgi:hypothetical protein